MMDLFKKKERLFCKGCDQEIKKGHDLKDLKYCRGDLVHNRCYFDVFTKGGGDPFQDAGSDFPPNHIHDKNMRILGYIMKELEDKYIDYKDCEHPEWMNSNTGYYCPKCGVHFRAINDFTVPALDWGYVYKPPLYKFRMKK